MMGMSTSTSTKMKLVSCAATGMTTSKSAALTEEHLEKFTWVHVMTTATTLTVYFVEVCSLIEHISSSWIWKYFIGFSNILEHFISMKFSIIIVVLMFIWMPFKCCLFISLFDFIFSCLLCYSQYLVEVFTFWFLKFKFSVLKFLSKTLSLWINLLYSFNVTDSFLKHL